jgi:hypothetical protein
MQAEGVCLKGTGEWKFSCEEGWERGTWKIEVTEILQSRAPLTLPVTGWKEKQECHGNNFAK